MLQEFRRSPTLKEVKESRLFESFFAGVILLNSLLIAVEVQYTVTYLERGQHFFFVLVSYAMNALFIAEICLRFYVDGLKGFFFSNGNFGWAVLDSTAAFVSCMEIVEQLAWSQSGALGGSVTNGSNVRILRMIRVARILRTFRALRLIRVLTHLQTLLLSMFGTLKSLMWASILMGGLLYVYAVTFTQSSLDGRLQAQLDPSFDVRQLVYYWGSLDASMATLFQAIANGISWRDAYEALGEVHVFYAWFFTSYMTIAYFVLLNVITGVFCNSAMESSMTNPELIARTLECDTKVCVDRLRWLFDRIDRNQSGSISVREFEQVMADTVAKAQFTALQLNVHDAWALFKLLDRDDSGEISIEEFLQGCGALKGGARSLEVATMRHESNVAYTSIMAALARLEDRVHSMSSVWWPEGSPMNGKALL